MTYLSHKIMFFFFIPYFPSRDPNWMRGRMGMCGLTHFLG